jgi:hypothetical protein
MPIPKSEIIPQLLKQCPELQKHWNEYQKWVKTADKPTESKPDDSALVLYMLIPAMRSGRTHFFPRFFEFLEQLFIEGDPETRIAMETVLRHLEKSSATRINGPDLLGGWMGPETKRYWKRICKEAAANSAARNRAHRKRPERLREYKVILRKCELGERAIPLDYLETLGAGMATKFGGDPDWLQGEECPECLQCKHPMTFIAQIDSIEHQNQSNPHSRKPVEDDQQWMFGDVGMIYVFFCFDCLETRSVFQCH